MRKTITGFALSILLFALGVSVDAQQPAKIPRIGYVRVVGVPSTPGPNVEAFRQGLKDLGYVEGENIVIEFRYAEGKPDRIPGLVTELVQLKVDVLISGDDPTIRVFKQATKTIPIVMVINQDPVATGLSTAWLVQAGISRGLVRLTRELSGKRLELLTEVVPGMARVGILWDSSSKGSKTSFKEYQAAASALKIQLQSLDVREGKRGKSMGARAGQEQRARGQGQEVRARGQTCLSLLTHGSGQSMPRHPRVHAEGLLYHVMARGNDGQKIFLRESDYQAFLEALRTARQRYPFSLYGYALMPNHFHLLLEVEHFPTARILQSLLTSYARRFNKIHHRRGHLFEGRYKAIVCDRDSYLLELIRYIHLNPVRASLVKQPGKWPWSGHAEYLGKEKRGLIDPGPVMGQLRTAAGYEAFIRDGAKVNYRPEWHPGDGAPFLGPERFVRKIAKEPVVLSSSRRATLRDLLKSVAAKSGLSVETLLRKGRLGSVVSARDRFIREAVLQQGYLACQVASFLNCHPSNISRALQKT